MNKKKMGIFILSLIVVCNFAVFNFINMPVNNTINLIINISSDTDLDFQVFFKNSTTEFTEENSIHNEITANRNNKISISIPVTTTELRFDYGNLPADITISSVYFKSFMQKQALPFFSIIEGGQSEIKELTEINNAVSIQTDGIDSYSIISIKTLNLNEWNLSSQANYMKWKKLIVCLVIDIVLIVLGLQFHKMITIPKELFYNRELIFRLAKNDFKTKYAGSIFGIIWAFIQPLSTILIYWFVFSVGLKSGSPVEDVPFIFWFMLGLVPWFFFQEAIINATNCMLEYSYLVKKVVFKISILPIIKISSSFFIHIVFILITLLVGLAYGFKSDLYLLQLPYYIFCIFFLTLGISYATSAIILFFKDLGQIINILLQVGMWMTPIMWSYTMIPTEYQWIEKLNPFFYIVEGYRSIFIEKHWFWENIFQTLYFWIFSCLMFSIGIIIFKKLKPHFADVL